MAILNNDAYFISFENNVDLRKTKGDATESAILKFMDLDLIEKLTPETASLFVLKDYDNFLKDFSIIRKLKNLSRTLKTQPKNIIIISSGIPCITTREKQNFVPRWLCRLQSRMIGLRLSALLRTIAHQNEYSRKQSTDTCPLNLRTSAKKRQLT